MKFKADTKDIIIFSIYLIFLLFSISLVTINLGNISTGEKLTINILPAFYIDKIGTTMLLFALAVGASIASVSSYFFEREKGFGLSTEKKANGYSKWAKEEEIIKITKPVMINSKEAEHAGIPLLYRKNVAFVDDSEDHALILGKTGSGKTQGIVLPTVKFLAKKGESMIITDPKGEIYTKTGQMLRDRGYNIIILNFRDPQNGNCWNPYHLPYKYYIEGNFDKANELLNDLALNIMGDDNNSDPFWSLTAGDYLTGLSLALFNDAKPEEININSVNIMMTVGDDSFGGSTYLKEYFNAKDPNSPECINALGTVNAPNETKGGILSVLKQKVKTLAVTRNLSEMLSRSDFDMDKIGEQKTVVFLIIQDEKTTYHALATIFVKQCYESLIAVAQKNGGKLPIRTNFIMDEFANMPKLKDMTTMITAARSRQIRFNMIIQNFAQLNQVYGKENAETIKGNCTIIYLLTQELSALEEISKLCGDKIIKVGKDNREETRPLITISELQKMKEEEAIVLKTRQSPFKTKLKFAYKNDFGDSHYPKDTYPTREMKEINLFDFKEFVKTEKKNKLFNILENSPVDNSSNKIFNPMMNQDFNVDDLVKRIDAKIAELEQEEEKEKALNNNETTSNKEVVEIKEDKALTDYISKEKIEVKNESQETEIKPKKKKELPQEEYKPIDSDDLITDDQFFDDFFGEE